MHKRILLLAGEESGVMYARQIAEKLQSRGAEIRGYHDYGFETGDLAVIGIFAVLRRLGFFLRVKRTMERAIDEWKPDVVCTVDYPGLNLKLAAYAKSRGIRAVHVVCPQVWAWHQDRIPKIERSLDKLCCFFPFEPAIFRPGFAQFVGHPLARVKAKGEGEGGFCRGEHGERGDVVAVLPGSRVGEIEKILPTLVDVIARLATKYHELKFAIPAANAKAKQKIESIIHRSSLITHSSSLMILDGGAKELMARSTCAIVASGTATLQAALARCPTVLVYRVGAITAVIARLVIKGVKHLGLANIIAEKSGMECPMPELLQQDFTADATFAIVDRWLTDEESRREAREKLDRVMSLLECDGDPIERIVNEL